MVLYTKYRPSDFDNLVGQEFIKKTLKQAITKGKTVGAYLFCGPRGTGKTSTARLFAKTINCLQQKNGNPCGVCEICRAFTDERLIDIVEIDAASHTGVDNIREIIEKSQFSPTKTKYKIYIIDEVHMLSKGAFNALLKILEEPPEHVKFILATTETHKVPETIISRCQRYDFKRISKGDTQERLIYIAESESIEVDKKALEYIVSRANGGMRNAISLFEQMISNGKVSYEYIIEQLGITPSKELSYFLEGLLAKNADIIDRFESLSEAGKNIKLFIKDLVFLTKDKAIEMIKSGRDISDYIYILEILDRAFIASKNSFDEYTTFLIALLQIIGGQDTKKELPEKASSPNSTKVSQKERTHIEKTKKIEDLYVSSEDINDIFGPKEEQNLTTGNSFSSKIPKTSKDTDFDFDQLQVKLKQNQAKGAVIFSLKGSKIGISGDTFTIKTPSSIAKNTLTNIENQDIIKKSLGDLGFIDLHIEVI